jgi:hypothetical protein
MENSAWTNWLNSFYTAVFNLAAYGFIAGSSCIPVAGCQSAPGFPREISQTVQAVGTSIATQAQWDRVLGRIRGHANNPGYRAAGGVEYFAEVKFVGFDGDVNLEAEGQGNGEITPETRAAIIRAFQGDTEARAFVLELLNRGELETTTQPVNSNG